MIADQVPCESPYKYSVYRPCKVYRDLAYLVVYLGEHQMRITPKAYAVEDF